MKMRKKLLSLLILALLTMGMLSALNLGPVVVSAAYDSPAVYVDPIYNDAGPKPPATYNITIETDYEGDDITAYQFSLTYNPNVLQGFKVFNDGILSGAISKLGTFNNTKGELSTTVAYYFGHVVEPGPGKLATITFNVTGLGDSDLILGSNTLLKGWDGEETYNIVDAISMPFHIGHGYFENLAAIHDVAVTDVTPSATDVVQGDLVTIDVTVENQGDVPETFDVTVWTGGLALETKPVVNLPNGTSNNLTLTFNWNTTGTAVASYTIVAVASTVPGETEPNTADNTFEDGIVTVSPVIYAAFTANPTMALTYEYIAFDASASLSHGAEILLYQWDFGREVVEWLVTEEYFAIGEIVGAGDGANTVFNLYHQNVVPETETVYLDGQITMDYTIFYPDGRLNFNTAPPFGDPVTDEAVGVGDNETKVFSLDNPVHPGTETIYLDGQITTDYNIIYFNGTKVTCSVNFITPPGPDASITADYVYGMFITADYDSSKTSEEVSPLIYNSTVPTYEYMYPMPGFYGVLLTVTDDLGRTSVPAYSTIQVNYPTAIGADLVNWKARAEKANWDASLDDDGYVNLTALAVNLGVGLGAEPINIAIYYQILTGRGGAPIPGQTIIVPYTLEDPGVAEELLYLFNASLYGWDGASKKTFFMRATLKYASDLTGTPDTWASSKDFKFLVKP